MIDPTLPTSRRNTVTAREAEAYRLIRKCSMERGALRNVLDAARSECFRIIEEMAEYRHKHNPECECEVIPASIEVAQKILAVLNNDETCEHCWCHESASDSRTYSKCCKCDAWRTA